MEEEPIFNPVEDTQSLDYSSDHTSTDVESNRHGDSGYHRIKIGPKHNMKTVEFYESKQFTGATIRYATTGFYTSHKVGSQDQDLYFKVVNTTHPANNTGVHQPCHLYYESPEQWERHFHTYCPENIKTTWREKYNRAIYRNMRV